jgi:hypothetical protein
MTRRYTGGFLSAKEQATDANTANGIFTLQEAAAATATGNFPTGRWTPQRSLRFRSGSSTYLTRTPSASTSKIWTWSAWVKRGGSLGSPQMLFSAGTVGTNDSNIYFETGDVLVSMRRSGATMVSTQVFRDTSAWYHLVVQQDSTQSTSSARMAIWVNGVKMTSFSTGTYPSLNEDSAYNTASAHYIGRRSDGYYFDGYMTDVNFIEGLSLDASYFGFTDPETGTWVPKRYTGTYGTNGFYLPFTDIVSPNGGFAGFGNNKAGIANGTQNLLAYSNNFTATTGGQTNWGVGTYSSSASNITDPASGTTAWSFTSTSGDWALAQQIAGLPAGQTLNASVWLKVPSGTLSVNLYAYQPSPFVLGGTKTVTLTTSWQRVDFDFTVISAFGATAIQIGGGSSIGNGQVIHVYGAQVTMGPGVKTYIPVGDRGDFYPSGFSVTDGPTYDFMVDVPGIAAVSSQQDIGGVVRGNYATLNPLFNGGYTLSEGNLCANGGGSAIVPATIGIPPGSGKFYWELTLGQTINSSNPYVAGMTRIDAPKIAHDTGGTTGSRNIYFYSDGSSGYSATWYENGSNIKSFNISGLNGGSSGTVMMYAYDSDTGKWWVGKDGSWGGGDGTMTGQPSTGQNPVFQIPTNYDMTPYLDHAGVAITNMRYNFGQRPFAYTPPTGFKSLNTTNLQTPVIKRPSDHFDVKLYTGNGKNLTVGATAKQTSAIQTKSVRLKKAAVSTLTRQFTTSPTSRTTYTISAWVKPNLVGTSAVAVWGTAGNWESLRWHSDGTIYWCPGSGKTWTTNKQYVAGQWYHVMVAVDTTQGANINRGKLYINGVQVINYSSQDTVTQNAQTVEWGVPSTSSSVIGATGGYGIANILDGCVSEFYYIDGQAKSPTDFGQFDANNNWVPKAYTGTYGNNGSYLPFNPPSLGNSAFAASFDSSKYISLPSNSAFAFGTGDFTVEGWFNISAFNANYSTLLSTRTGGAGMDIQIYNTGGQYQLMVGNNSGAVISANNVVTPNEWAHIAASRSSGTFYLFVDGILVASGASSQNFTDTGFYIGAGSGGNNNQWSGLASNVRVVKGQALYTAAFTPTNTALTTTSQGATAGNVSVLTLQNSTLVDNSSNNFTVTGTTGISTVYPYAVSPTYSTQFVDGSGDYQTVPASSAFQFGTGDFTIEFWAWLEPYVAGGTSTYWASIIGIGVGSSDANSATNTIGIWQGDGTGTSTVAGEYTVIASGASANE